MQTPFAFIISPLEGNRYKNEVEFGDGNKLIVNTDMFNHQFISREAKVLATPSGIDTPIKVGDTVIVHHNIFRRWHDQMGRERNSSDFISEDKYKCTIDQIYMYKSDTTWKGLDDFCFVQPVENDEKFIPTKEKRHFGVIVIGNDRLKELGVEPQDVISFFPNREYEFVVEGKRMYRIRTVDIFAKHEDKEVKVYDPEWTSYFA